MGTVSDVGQVPRQTQEAQMSTETRTADTGIEENYVCTKCFQVLVPKGTTGDDAGNATIVAAHVHLLSHLFFEGDFQKVKQFMRALAADEPELSGAICDALGVACVQWLCVERFSKSGEEGDA
jgi:hypothetical protein